MGRRLASAAFLAVAVLLVVGGSAKGAQSAVVSIGSGSVNPGDDTTVILEARNVSGLGAMSADIVYDPTVIDAIACSADPGGALDLGACNESFAPNKVRFSGISTEGVSGQVRLAEVTFRAVGQSGDASTLDIRLPTFADADGRALSVIAEDGLISIGGTEARDSQTQPGSTSSTAVDDEGEVPPPPQGTTPDLVPTPAGGAGQEPAEGETRAPTSSAGETGEGGASTASGTSTPTASGEQASGGSRESSVGGDGIDWWVWLAASLGGAALVAAVMLLLFRLIGRRIGTRT